MPVTPVRYKSRFMHTQAQAMSSAVSRVMRHCRDKCFIAPRPVSYTHLKTVHHTLQVTNPGTEELRFGIGFHPAFNVPFDAKDVYKRQQTKRAAG